MLDRNTPINEDNCLTGACGLSVRKGPPGPSAELKDYCCQIEPRVHFQNCRCAALSNPWLRNKLTINPRTASLIAYVRTTEFSKTAVQQLQLIEHYCQAHGYKIAKVFVDDGVPAAGLQQSIDSLDETAGIIATDTNRFVEHGSDRLRQLRPFVHHFLCHTDKHLITIAEGIDTRSPAGQRAALELLADSKGCFSL